ncbi:MAG: ATP-binding protein [Acidobacteriota bacterium]
MKKGDIEISIESKLSYLDLVQEVSDVISRRAGFDQDTGHWIGMSVRELVANAIQHGNQLDEKKMVGIRFELLSDRLVIAVRDEGHGFDDAVLPDPLSPENLLKSSGRGIFYVRSFMDEVNFHQLPEGGMEVRMGKMFKAGNSKEEGK